MPLLPRLVIRIAATALLLSTPSLGSARAQAPSLHLVADLSPGADTASTNPTGGIAWNGRALFLAKIHSHVRLCATDGSPAGTSIIGSSVGLAGGGALPATFWTRVGNSALFGIQFGNGVWISDGTSAGTRRITTTDVYPTAVPDRWHGGPWILFGANLAGRDYLWRTDGDTVEVVQQFAAPRALTAVAWNDAGVVRYLTFLVVTGPFGSRGAWVSDGGANPVPVVPAAGPIPTGVTGIAVHVDPVSGALHVALAGSTPATGADLFHYVRTPGSSSYVPQPSEVAPGPTSAAPRDLVVRGSELVFTANHGTGRELWRMPFATGVPAVLELEPGPQGSDPRGLAVLPSATGAASPDVVFTAATSGFGREPWRYDGAAAGWLADVTPGPGDSNAQVLGFADGRIFFAAEAPGVGRELWRSDGTAAGTQLAFDAVPGRDSSNPTATCVLAVGGTERLLYAAESPLGRELHAVDAATAAPQVVRDLAGGAFSSQPVPFLSLNGGRALVLAQATGDLWITDGTAGSATLLATAAQLGGDVAVLPGQSIAFDDGSCLFVVFNTTGVVPITYTTARLWRSDGTAAGTQPGAYLGSVWPGGLGGFFEFGGAVYSGIRLLAPTTVPETSILRTDRSGASFVILWPTPLLRVYEWEVVGDRIFLSASSGSGKELFVWQPPSAPTPVADIWPGAGSSNPRSLIAFRNRCYFVANDGVHGDELWASNGLAGGTFMVVDGRPGSGHGVIPPLVSVGTALVYAGDDGVHGREPWRSTGVGAGTQMIADLQAGPGSSSPSRITAVHVGVFACTANDGVSGNELWRVDTVAGATLFDLRPGPFGSSPANLYWSTRHLFFTADDGIHGREPWYASWIDFQAVGMVADLSPGIGSSYPAHFGGGVAGPHVLCSADGGSLIGRELFAFDATGASTPIGTSCVQPFQTMELRSTAPILGQGLTYWVFDPGMGVPAVTLLSPEPSTLGGLTLPGVACPIWVDPNAYVVVDQFTTPGSFTRTIPVPSLPTMLGAVMRMQCVFDYPPMLATNGLELVFGN